MAANSPDLHIDMARGKRILLEEDRSGRYCGDQGTGGEVRGPARSGAHPRDDARHRRRARLGGCDRRARTNALDFLADGWGKGGGWAGPVAARTRPRDTPQTGGQGTAGHSSDGYGCTRCLSRTSTRPRGGGDLGGDSRWLSSAASSPPSRAARRRCSASIALLGSGRPRHCQSTVRSLYSSEKHTP